VVVRIGAREALVGTALCATLLAGWHLREWNRRRLLAKEERRKARAKEWARIKRRATDALGYTAVLVAVGTATWLYTKAQNAWQGRNEPPTMAANTQTLNAMGAPAL